MKIHILLFLAACGISRIRGEFTNPCFDGSIDASTRTQDGSSYLFKGNYTWKIVNGGVDFGYPRLVSEDWKGLESGPLDAAFTWNDGSTFIFKGDKYWRFYNKEAKTGYPRKISNGFKKIPNNVDAAFVWENDSATYFFKESQYWRYAPKKDVPTEGNYPAPISAWKGIPNNVTAAISWHGGITYFFKGSEYYSYNNKNGSVSSGYPYSTSRQWFLCDAQGNFQATDGFGFERENSETSSSFPTNEKSSSLPKNETSSFQTNLKSSTFQNKEKSSFPTNEKSSSFPTNEESTFLRNEATCICPTIEPIKNEIPTNPPRLAGTPEKFINPCVDGSIDAATRTKDGSTYFFKEDYYWKIVPGGVAYGYPRLISADWSGLESGPIDAALTRHDGTTYIFKGGNFWIFINKKAEKGYPRKTSSRFNGIPEKIGTALIWSTATYFTKGNQYWEFSPTATSVLNSNYMSAWAGIPDDVTAAMNWEGNRSIFFKGSAYYEYGGRGESGSTSTRWFGCDDKQNYGVVKNDTGVNNCENENSRNAKLVKALQDIQSSLKTVL